ncbi:T9SS type A sorting domain-containing protein, partial [Candidatus Poribacteria bacterium]|nr:T9SS type A sorting domain-containing protein [Candidatus Poribacteria bacterium]
VFDPAVLEAIEVNEGDFLKAEGGTTFFQGGTINNATGKITKLSSARLSEDGVSGTGTLLSVTFAAKAGGETRLSLHNFQLGSVTGEIINAGPHEFVFTIEGQLVTGDVNRDGQVSVLDLILVAQHLGKDVSANPQADVNRDGVINIQDLILVAQHLGESTDAAAPSAIAINDLDLLDPAMIQAWITQAQIEDDGSIAFRQGIANLERLLALFIPEETALLHNYPNPFNPETWIPYQLAEPAEVILTIYSVNGALVRTLKLGYQPAGIYQTRTRAAYWDGKNEVSESVASGIYFYTLTAGDFNATRKMLIRK